MLRSRPRKSIVRCLYDRYSCKLPKSGSFQDLSFFNSNLPKNGNLRSSSIVDSRVSKPPIHPVKGAFLGSFSSGKWGIDDRERRIKNDTALEPPTFIITVNQAGMQRIILAAGGFVAFMVAIKPIYEKYFRRDVSVSHSTKPVLAKLKTPIHASHRGGSRIWPENTMLAFRNAVEWTDETGLKRRTQLLEFDIQKTKDGHLVVMHNESVDATTNGTGLVSSLTLEKIRELDAGYRFTLDNGQNFPYRGKGLKVPTLLEVLNEFVPVEGLIFYLDFKEANSVADTMKHVREFGIEERVICGAIPASANREVLRLKPSCAPATPDINSMIMLYVCYMLGVLWLVPMRHEIVGTTAYRWGMKVLTIRMVKAFKKRDRLMAVFGDHLDSMEGQLECLSLGCDFLVTDRPDLLHASIDKWRGDLSVPKTEGGSTST